MKKIMLSVFAFSLLGMSFVSVSEAEKGKKIESRSEEFSSDMDMIIEEAQSIVSATQDKKVKESAKKIVKTAKKVKSEKKH